MFQATTGHNVRSAHLPRMGKEIVSPNFRPVNCPFCKAPLPPEGAPAAPSAGGTLVAPGAPTVSGAPKPPSGK